MSEFWHPVAEFPDTYQVSDMGNVRSLTRTIVYRDGRVGIFKGRDLKIFRGANGYASVTLLKGQRRLVHRLVATAFIAKPSACDVVNHLNGNKMDNRADNLEWGTYQSNNAHARNSGLNVQKGENCNLSIYPDSIIYALRRVHAKYQPNFRELAMLFDMSETQAADIVKGLSRA